VSAQGAVIVLCCLLVVGVLVVMLSSIAGRLDRLHIRLATTHASLNRQLIDRAAATADVAHSGALDSACSVLLLAAADTARHAATQAAQRGDVWGRDDVESALSVDLRAVLGRPDAVAAAWHSKTARPLLVELAESCDRGRLARRFHDDLTARTAAVRRQRLVRLLHLAGHAAWPVVVELDDEPPAALLVAADHAGPLPPAT